jgi:cytochrome c
MSGFELNKIIAAILLASLIAMIVGTVANILYKPNLDHEQRGYSVGVTEGKEQVAGKQPDEVKLDIAALMKNANAEAGKEVIKKCISCHSFDKGGPNKIGPNLWNVYGSEKGKLEGYKFSTVMVSKGGIWDEESLFSFLHKPTQYIPGTKMSFVGLNKPEDIANVIMFLKTVAHD